MKTRQPDGDRSLKIGLLLDDSLDSPDGVQQYVLTLGGWLQAQGHEVHYLVGQTKRTDVANIHSLSRNLQVAYNGNRMSIPLPASRRGLRQLLAEHSFDIIHVQVPYSPYLAGRLLRLLPPTTAVVGTFHVLPYDRLAIWTSHALALLNWQTAKRFDAMISSTEPTQAFAKQVYGFSSAIIPHPIVLDRFRPASDQTKPNTMPRIVFLGRLVERKGVMQLLQAVSYLKTHELYNEPFQVIIGGKGPLYAELQSFVQKHDLQDQVTFTGFVAEADKADFLAQADIAVFPSLSGESFGISLLEALASSRGVVLGGDNPGYRAVLAPLAPEQLIQPQATSDFAATLADWLVDAMARSRAALAQKKYVEQFDEAIVGAHVVEIYNQALRTRRNVQ